MTPDTEMTRGVPGRPGGSSLQPPRPLLIQVRVTPGEKARSIDLAWIIHEQFGLTRLTAFV